MEFEDQIYGFIQEITCFDYRIESIDHLWEIVFPDQGGKWHHIKIVKYHEVYFVYLVDGDLPSLEIKPKRQENHFENVTAWNHLLISARIWLKSVKKNWIKANTQVQENYPLNRRLGLVPNALTRASLPDIYRIDQALGKAKTKKFIHLVENGYFRNDKNTTCSSMTADHFFDYCKIAYVAGRRKDDQVDESLSGREMYHSYADGRDEGLLEIIGNSPQEFSDWLDGKHPKKTTGGHPWEIKRGGNTTHIDLYVSRPQYSRKEGFQLTLSGHAIGRLKKTICMFLGIHDAGFPINIANPEDIRQRLLAQDNIGIIPCYDSLHRANQNFREDQAVFDVLHFDDLGRYKSRIKPFITWKALPILKPKDF